MIPDDLVGRMREQAEENPCVFRSPAMRENVRVALLELGIPIESKFGEFCLDYRLDEIWGFVGHKRTLLDICESSTTIGSYTRYLREHFNLGEEFICLDSDAQRTCTLYLQTTGAIYEVNLYDRDAFSVANLLPQWSDFHELMMDYAAIPNQWAKPEFWETNGAQ